MVVDTLFDKPLTQAMLDAMHGAAPSATRDYDFLVNTHSNGDHCNGNELVGDAQIIASAACLAELANESPEMMLNLLQAAPDLGDVGEFFVHCFGQFDFRDINRALPNRTFEGELEVKVGDKQVLLKQVGPAHTHGVAGTG